VTAKQAVEKVLTGKRSGMRVPAIIEAGVPLATSLKGKTPGQTFYSTLYSESKKPDGLVVQVERGTLDVCEADTADEAGCASPSPRGRPSSHRLPSTRCSSSSAGSSGARGGSIAPRRPHLSDQPLGRGTNRGGVHIDRTRGVVCHSHPPS
jgi:hypothetical protein